MHTVASVCFHGFIAQRVLPGFHFPCNTRSAPWIVLSSVTWYAFCTSILLSFCPTHFANAQGFSQHKKYEISINRTSDSHFHVAFWGAVRYLIVLVRIPGHEVRQIARKKKIFPCLAMLHSAKKKKKSFCPAMPDFSSGSCH